MQRHEVTEAVRLLPLRLGPWLQFVAHRRAYRYIDEVELRARRRSRTVFIFGSGASLNDIRPEEWDEIAEHDTFGFNWWVHQRFVRTDFQLIRGIPDTDRDPRIWRPQLDEYFRLLRDSPQFAQAILLVQTGFRAINGNRSIGYRYVPERNPLFLWRTSMRVGYPSRSFGEGLVHGQSTIQECINAAYLLGWSQIVLAGVDLYDRRYFWLSPNETRSLDRRRGATAEQQHIQAAMGLVHTLGRWAGWLADEGVELSVLNPHSLLASVLPAFDRRYRSGVDKGGPVQI
jgi:hypothetical protein